MNNENLEQMSNEVAESAAENSEASIVIGKLAFAGIVAAAVGVGVLVTKVISKYVAPWFEQLGESGRQKKLAKLQKQQEALNALKEKSYRVDSEEDFEN